MKDVTKALRAPKLSEKICGVTGQLMPTRGSLSWACAEALLDHLSAVKLHRAWGTEADMQIGLKVRTFAARRAQGDGRLPEIVRDACFAVKPNEKRVKFQPPLPVKWPQ